MTFLVIVPTFWPSDPQISFYNITASKLMTFFVWIGCLCSNSYT